MVSGPISHTPLTMLITLALATLATPVYHYIRSSRDGSLPEHVVIRMASPRQIETFKYVKPGTASAYVTCTMEADLSGPESVRSWRLSGTEKKLIATIDASRKGGFARVRVLPTGEPEESVLLPPHGWHIFNMDLGSLTASLAATKKNTVRFSFIEPNFTAVTPVMTDTGAVTATRMGWERHTGRQCQKWELTGGALKAKRGYVWMSLSGAMVAAALPIPNHQGYRDFAMTLISESSMTSQQWGSFVSRTVQGRNP